MKKGIVGRTQIPFTWVRENAQKVGPYGPAQNELKKTICRAEDSPLFFSFRFSLFLRKPFYSFKKEKGYH